MALTHCSLGRRPFILELVEILYLGSIRRDATERSFQAFGPSSNEIFHLWIRQTRFRKFVDVASIYVGKRYLVLMKRTSVNILTGLWVSAYRE